MYFSHEDQQWETVIIPEEEVDLYNLEGIGSNESDVLLCPSGDFQTDQSKVHIQNSVGAFVFIKLHCTHVSSLSTQVQFK